LREAVKPGNVINLTSNKPYAFKKLLEPRRLARWNAVPAPSGLLGFLE
jgi:hypothetical protein